MSWLDTFFNALSTLWVNGISQNRQRGVNLIAGTNVTLTTADNPSNARTDVTINASGGGGGSPTGSGIAIVSGGAWGTTLPVGAAKTVVRTNAGATDFETALIDDGDVSASAAIAVTKVAAGTNGQVLQTSSGTPTWGQVSNANIAALAAVAVTKLAPGSNGQVLTTSGGAPAWAAGVAGYRPSSDSNTLLDYRFNETAKGVLVNSGSYGTGSSPVGPAPTTLTAGFTQPAVGSTVVVSVNSSTGYAAGQLILVGARPGSGAGANYYYCTGTGLGTLTLKNLGVTGGNYTSPGSTVGTLGTAVQTNLDILFTASTANVAILGQGPFDFCHSFNGSNSSNWYNYGNNIGGGCPDFVGINKLSMHILINPTKYNNTFMQWFGYANSQTWGAGNFSNISLNADNGSAGNWAFGLQNQSFTNVSVSPSTSAGYYNPWAWQLISATVDMTITTNAINIYKNGQLVGQGNLSATGTLSLGSAGFWYVGNPGPGNGDTGDNYQGFIAMARVENVVRSQGYIQSMWGSIINGAANWPVP